VCNYNKHRQKISTHDVFHVLKITQSQSNLNF